MIKKIGTYVTLMLLLFSCKGNDVAPMAEDGDTDLKINISSRGATADDNLINEGEWVIKRIRIYAFDGTVLDCQKYIGNISSDNMGYYETVMKVKPNTNKNIIVVINESDNMTSALNAVTSPSDLNNIKFNLADYTNQAYISDARPTGFNLPMYGATTGINATGSNPIDVDVNVIRAVARVDLYFKSAGNTITFRNGMKILSNNIPTYGYINANNNITETFEESVLYTMGTSETYNVPITDNETEATRFCTFYTPERACILDGTKMLIKLLDVTSNYGVSSTYLVNFEYLLDYISKVSGDEEILSITRNNIYKVVGTFIERDYPIVSSVSLYDWTPESYDILM